ncbi:hypothetical protein [Mucilaginibacter sp. 3215]|uniref:hypothetical protein n=1 Tax=Mucilaginibacter sp. 3215 TaxID=3373912 RepID=UPI003D1B884E
MKTPIVLLLLILMFFAGCKSSGQKDKQKDSTRKKDTSRTANTASAQGDSSSLSFEEADTLVSAFRNGRTRYNHKTSSWFKKDLIMQLCTLLENPTNKLDGIRVYLAWKKGRHTFLIVPTRLGGSYIPQKPACDQQAGQKIDIHEDVFNIMVPGIGKPVHRGADEYGNDEGAALGDSGSCSSTLRDTKYVFFNLENHTQIPCSVAGGWVRRGMDPTENINTYSEWFDFDFVRLLKQEFEKTDMTRDGVRIYLARKDTIDCTQKKRHVFLWVTTYPNTDPKTPKKMHIDDYIPKIHHLIVDNGEQCLNNCNGAKLPASK